MNAHLVSRTTLAALLTTALLGATAVEAAAATAVPTAAATAVRGAGDPLAGLPAWDRVPTPNVGTGDNQLYGVDMRAPDDGWAVGYSTEDTADDPLIEHYDGTSWAITPTPDIGDSQFGAQLLDVDAIAPDDVWAVGGYGDSYSLIMHWDGTDWSLVNHPNTGLLQRLESVSAAGPNDVWAVGYIADGGPSRTHVLHWNGVKWSVVTSPTGGGYNDLHGVDVISADDVWAVGEDSGRSLTLHWNGSAWSRVASPANTLTAVSAVASNDVWAVGTTAGNTLTEHWDGASWSVVPSPQPPGIVRLYGVSAIASDDVWAVGESSAAGTLALRWDGAAWTIEPSPNGDGPNILRGVSALAADNVVLVGESDFATYIQRWDGTELRVEPSADRGVGRNDLRGVHATAPDDVWAVGTVERKNLIQHWDGTAFEIVPSPSKAHRVNVLEDVDATRAADAWAVGHRDSIDGLTSRTVALHWDGSSWKAVRTPGGGAPSARQLLAVATVAPDDVWAVGTKGALQDARALALHWDGKSWQSVRNSCGDSLSGITAFATDDVWAVGAVVSCHWNGQRWRSIAFDDPANPDDLLDMADVDGTSSTDLWAVGAKFSQCGEGLCPSGEIQHFDGAAWSTTRVAAPTLDGVAAVGADDVWAVGFGRVSILHFDGGEWLPVPAPDLAGDGQADLTSISASGPDDIWAVGPQVVGAPNGASLALHARASSSGALVGDTAVSGATVTWIGAERGSVLTDVFGHYQIGGLPAGSYRLTVTREGCVPASRTVTVVAGTTVSRDLPLDC